MRTDDMKPDGKKVLSKRVKLVLALAIGLSLGALVDNNFVIF